MLSASSIFSSDSSPIIFFISFLSNLIKAILFYQSFNFSELFKVIFVHVAHVFYAKNLKDHSVKSGSPCEYCNWFSKQRLGYFGPEYSCCKDLYPSFPLLIPYIAFETWLGIWKVMR